LEERIDRRRACARARVHRGALPDVLEGRIEPGRVFDRTGSIEDVPDGYRAMNDREVLKFQIKP
jgi:threonine dehydrogenase-like Zn-dependent dehydrogenase